MLLLYVMDSRTATTRCMHDQHPLPDWCVTNRHDEVDACSDTITTCVIAGGIRQIPDRKPVAFAPAVGRSCSFSSDARGDTKIWNTMAKGQKMLCYEIVRDGMPGPTGVPITDRRCICAEDKCNELGWDRLMQQPVLPANYSNNDVVKPKPGNYSLAALQDVLNLNFASLGTDIGTGGNTATATTSSSTGSISGVPTDATENSTAVSANNSSNGVASTAGGSGSSTGLIAGIAAGVVILAALAGGLWYWFKIRKRKDSTSSAATEASNTESGDSGGDD
ncbi:uncharacterized protein LOC129582564 isoform X2 [Paramacrobiotus metropolitanus]|uniref:uncharacterized protein LOC129582564 isoform X2 n=1 Tax=Paramacrobiotus metropolitanus TaxID=2943436 RepID=UPI002445A636|nr:uncharacterized protein LOC129582564 isoform X2 [Paramacrobiotus metropolitanus]